MAKANKILELVKFTIEDTAIGPAITISYPKGIDKFKEAVGKW